MKDIIIKSMEEQDIKDVAVILTDSWKIAYKDIIDKDYLENLKVEERIEKVKKEYKDGSYIVAKDIDTNQVIGLSRFGDRIDDLDRFTDYDGEIYGLYVKPGLLRNGVGSRLLKYAKQELKNKGKSKMILWCLKKNSPSRKFYESMGGTLLGEKTRNIGGKEYSLVGYGYELKDI